MRTLPARYDPERVEAETRAFWTARGLPRSGRPLGPATGARVHLFMGALLPAEGHLPALHRALVADAEGRYLAMAGRRPTGLLVVRASRRNPAELAGFLDRLGIWIGSPPPRTAAEAATRDQIEASLQRLAAAGLIQSREAPMRACPRCRTPRTPETIVYVEEDGPAYLVRFALEGDDPKTNLLVWTDAAWKLLGASAVLIHPDLPYVRLRFRRRGTEEQILVLRSAIERLSAWFEGSEMEVLEERPGSEWVGRSYTHPFSTEFPMLARIPPPAGTLVAATEVTDSGTGAVPLVPAHGGGDHSVAQNAALAGWPVLALNGQLTQDVPGKYAGLPLDSAEAFATRDLNDSGMLFAQLTVRRGVPHCSLCGSPTIWFPGRAWCAEPSRLPPERLEMLRRLLPNDPLPPPHDAVPWPITEWTPTDDPQAPAMSECGSCGRLGPAGPPSPCDCGQTRRTLRRRLLPAFHEVLAQWAADSPYPPGEAARLYVPDRRRMPAAIHHLFGMQASGASVGDIRAHRVATLPGPSLASKGPADSNDGLRAALLRLDESPRGGEVGLSDRRQQEERRLRKFWEIARDVTHRLTVARYAADQGSIVSHLNELEEEDRAFLSLFERMRLDVLRDYDLGEIGKAHDRLVRFLEDDLRDGYLSVVRPRLDAAGLPPTKAAAFRLLAHVVPLWAELYAPIAPHTMEAIHRAFRGDSDSLFDRRFAPIQEMVLDAKLEDAYRQWQSFAVALKRYRRELGLPAETLLASVVLFVRDEEIAQALRAARPVLTRLARVDRIEVASPNQPWDGKRVEARPIPSEIQRIYPAQAARIVRILEGMNGRRLQDALRARSLEIALEGQPVPILPSMVEFTEALPPGIVPVPWSLGELFVQVPEALAAGSEGHPPALTPDGFRLLNALRRHLRRGPQSSAADRIVVAAKGSLAEELEKHAPALSTYFEGREFELRLTDEGFPRSETVFGRTRRGERWSAWLPGVTVPVRAAGAATRQRRPRVRPVVGLAPEPDLLEFLDDDLRARESTIHDTVEAFDREFGRPIVGPSKLAAAWDVGLHSFDDFSHAAYDLLAPVAGFGPYVAEHIVHHFGGAVPQRVPRPELHDRFVRRRPTPAPPEPDEDARPSEPEEAAPSLVPELPIAPPVEEVTDPEPNPPAEDEVPFFADSTAPAPEVLLDAPPADQHDSEPGTDEPPPPGTDLPVELPPEGDEVPSPTDRAIDEAPALAPLDASGPTSDSTLGSDLLPSEVSAPPGPAPETTAVLDGPESTPEGSAEMLPSDLEPGQAEAPLEAPADLVRAPADEIELGGGPVTPPGDAVDAPDESHGEASDIPPVEEPTVPPEPADAPAPLPTEELPVADPLALPPEALGEFLDQPSPPPSVLPETPPGAEEPAEFVGPPDENSPGSPIPFPSERTGPLSDVTTDLPDEAPPDGEAAPSIVLDLPPEVVPPTDASPEAPEPQLDTRLPSAPLGSDAMANEGGIASVEPRPPASAAPEEVVPTTRLPLLPLEPPTVPDLGKFADSEPPRPPEPAGPVLETPMAGPVGPVPAPSGPAPGVELWPGGTADPAWHAFLEATASGHRGVCLSREFPDRLRAFLGHRDVEVYWLSNVGRESSVRPGDLPAISALFQRFLTERGATAVYLEGIEYLLRVHGLAKSLEFLRGLDEVARSRDARVWIPINPALVDSATHQELLSALRVHPG